MRFISGPTLYFLLVLAIGGVFYAPWVLSSYGLFPAEFTPIFVTLGGVSPTLAAVISDRRGHSGGGLKYLFGQLVSRRSSIVWLLVALFLPLLIGAIAILMWVASGGEYEPPDAALVFLPLLLANLIANIWEEIGWRGYALPSLQERHSALISSIIVGIFWGVWHWPHFSIKDSQMISNYGNFAWFLAVTIAGSVIYTWLYNSSEGSLLVTSLYHASGNASGMILFMNGGIADRIYPFYLATILLLASSLLLAFGPGSLSVRGKIKHSDIRGSRSPPARPLP